MNGHGQETRNQELRRNDGHCGQERKLNRVEEEMNYVGLMVDYSLVPLVAGKRGAPFNLRHGDQDRNKGEVANTERSDKLFLVLWQGVCGNLSLVVPVELYR